MGSNSAAHTLIAVAQFAPHTDKSANLHAVRAHAEQASSKGARLLLCPEYTMFAVGRLDQRMAAAAEPLTGQFVDGLRSCATEFGIHLIAGTTETKPGSEQAYNTVVAVTPDGELAATYRKVHLYDAFGFAESAVIAPGEITEPAVFMVDDLAFGIQTCYDLRFPEAIRRVADAGAQVLLLPAQWVPGPLKQDHWRTLLRARAIENTMYVAAAGHSAPRGSGDSMIIDPAGIVLAEAADRVGVITAAASLQDLAQVRAQNPSLSLRRLAI